MALLAYDLGTSALKASVMLEDGTIVASADYSYPTQADASGANEQDPGDWWHAVCTVSKQLCEKYPKLMKEIAGIGVSGHMLGCVSLDRSGEPLRPAMIHSDSRSVTQTSQIHGKIGRSALYAMTGNVLDARSSLSKVLWIKENQPEVYKKTEKFMQSKDYIVFKLTGCLDSTDYSDASHAQWINITKKTYLTDSFLELGIDVCKFPTLHRGIDVVGKTTHQAAMATGLMHGIPVVAGGGDGACASIAAGLVQPGDIYCSLGTTAWISQNTGKPIFDEKQRLFNIMSMDGLFSNSYGTVQNAGKAITWATKTFSFENPKQLDIAAGQVSPGSEGLVFLPYLDGERSPVFDTDARGVFFSISSTHDKRHFARSVLEGTGYALRSILDIFREHSDISTMRLIGGGGKSELWRHILSDILSVDLLSLGIPAGDATSTGAAFAAGVGIGLYKDLAAAASQVHTEQQTGYNDKNKTVYSKGYAKYEQLYPLLKNLFQLR